MEDNGIIQAGDDGAVWSSVRAMQMEQKKSVFRTHFEGRINGMYCGLEVRYEKER